MTPEYKNRRALKHASQRHVESMVLAEEPCPDCGSSKHRSCHTQDDLGPWQGGLEVLKGAKNWVALKIHPSRTADRKNTSGKSSGGTVERSSDYFKGGKKRVLEVA